MTLVTMTCVKQPKECWPNIWVQMLRFKLTSHNVNPLIDIPITTNWATGDSAITRQAKTIQMFDTAAREVMP